MFFIYKMYIINIQNKRKLHCIKLTSEQACRVSRACAQMDHYSSILGFPVKLVCCCLCCKSLEYPGNYNGVFHASESIGPSIRICVRQTVSTADTAVYCHIRAVQLIIRSLWMLKYING